MYSMKITLPITLFEKNATFLDPNIYVVTLYEIVTRGKLTESRKWFRSLRSLNHNKYILHILVFHSKRVAFPLIQTTVSIDLQSAVYLHLLIFQSVVNFAARRSNRFEMKSI